LDVANQNKNGFTVLCKDELNILKDVYSANPFLKKIPPKKDLYLMLRLIKEIALIKN